ncbi:MAG: fluoride efflux transporter FluC [Acidimicrobiales bacterium]
MIVLGLLVAGGIGTLLRYAVDHLVQRRLRTDFPLGILLVNVSGSLVLGVLVGSNLHHGVPAGWLTVAGTGMIGAYTTFSTFTFDAVRLAENEQWGFTLLTMVGGIGAGLVAAAAGLALGTLT